jgi:serine/threonine protein kinase
MKEQQWATLKEVLDGAWDLPAVDRPTFLDRACAGNPELRSSVEALLEADRDIGDFLETPAVREAADWTGRQLGPFQILREIGHGGMGTVFLAERVDGEYRKRVAIKLVNPDCGAGAVLRRFRRERQVLAELDHPNIARMLDGNATEEGVPYLVMEYIEGVRIDVWCDRRKASLRDRLRLFQSVCAAVQYAHERQIIHRDIKPGNILVTGDGVTKLLDFGVAKVLSSDAVEETTETTLGFAPLTPEYASPEQARGERVDASCDIYALGVVLYRLLVGRLPDAGLAKPSLAAQKREYRGDIDSIVCKALHQNARQRYASVSEFAADLARYLSDRPVYARNATLAYRGRKFVKRNPLSTCLTAGLACAVMITATLARQRHGQAERPIVLASLSPLAPPIEAPETIAVNVQPKPKSLAIVSIDNNSSDNTALQGMELSVNELLTNALMQAKGMQVISAGRIRELLSRRTDRNRLTIEAAREVAREAHADLMLRGALSQAGNAMRLNLDVRDAATGRVDYTNSVEASGERALFDLVDEASRRILGHLSPADAASGSAASGLSQSVEALKAYEEGLAERARFQSGKARTAFRHAIELDPQFFMAQYQLADHLRWDDDIPEARRTIALALAVAEHSPVPRLYSLLAQSLELRIDMRVDEAAKLLEVAHREFPRETEPAFQLAAARALGARFGEAAALLEEVVRIDPRHALAHDQLGYEYAFMGKLDRALASIDRYAALLPNGHEAPICTRADAYMINERYDQALAEYQKIGYRAQAAVAAMHGGNYDAVPALMRRRQGPPNIGLTAEFAALRGRLAEAGPGYEAAAKKEQTRSRIRPWFCLLSAARIYLEQGQVEELLALGQRDETPWAAGLRGTALLLLHRETEAEKEFVELRNGVIPLLGDYVASRAVEFHRMQAALYTKHFDRVIQIASRLPSAWWSLYSLDLGRAYLETGAFAEADHYLRLSRQAQQAFFMNNDLGSQHNFLGWLLADFYLGQAMLKSRRNGDAIRHNAEFVKHFEDSSARLPQLVLARKLAARVALSPRGKPVWSQDFSDERLDSSWSPDRLGEWKTADGIATMTRRPGETGSAKLWHKGSFHDAVFECSFLLEGEGTLILNFFGDKENYGGKVWIKWNGLRASATGSQLADGSADLLDWLKSPIESGKWHKAVVELRGGRILAQIDGGLTVVSEAPGLDVDKNLIVLAVDAPRAQLDYVRMYEIDPSQK